jgi:hypothetical protein
MQFRAAHASKRYCTPRSVRMLSLCSIPKAFLDRSLDEENQKIFDDQQRLRENMNALKGSPQETTRKIASKL